MIARPFAYLVLLLQCLGMAIAGHAQSKSPSKRATPTAIKMARWSAAVEENIGMSKSQFESMGLRKLTAEEFAQLFLWAYESRSKAIVGARATELTYTCGRSDRPADPAAYQKVKVYLDMGEKTPSELASGIRQRVRGMSDVEIVYTESDADIVLSVLAYQNESKAGYQLGYTVSIVSAEPCEWRLGESKGRMRSRALGFSWTPNCDENG